jgi:pilus assembly protein CpaB
MDRQRVLIVFGVAWVSAALLTWFLWRSMVAPRQEKMVRVAAAARDMAAGTRLTAKDVRLVSVLEKDLPRTALLDAKLAENRALLYPVLANETLTTAKLAASGGAEGLPSTIPSGMRAVSVAVTDISGVAGLVQPRAHVDVLFTRAGSMAEALTTTVLEDVQVLSIGRATEVQASTPGPATGAASTTQPNLNVSAQRAITLLVTPEEARKLELARNQGRLSLALRNPLDKSRLESRDAETAEGLDPNLFTRVRRPLPAGANVRDPKVWAQLTGQDEPVKPKKPEEKKEPPKPRHVIDVFRGDKHLQETFH